MSRVVVAWKPLSENASAAASMSRWTVSGSPSRAGTGCGAGRSARPARGLVDEAVMVDSMPEPGETKQALSQRRSAWRRTAFTRGQERAAMPRNVYGPEHEDFRRSVREFVERTLKPR